MNPKLIRAAQLEAEQIATDRATYEAWRASQHAAAARFVADEEREDAMRNVPAPATTITKHEKPPEMPESLWLKFTRKIGLRQ